jgi:hypothetical protein
MCSQDVLPAVDALQHPVLIPLTGCTTGCTQHMLYQQQGPLYTLVYLHQLGTSSVQVYVCMQYLVPDALPHDVCSIP